MLGVISNVEPTACNVVMGVPWTVTGVVVVTVVWAAVKPTVMGICSPVKI